MPSTPEEFLGAAQQDVELPSSGLTIRIRKLHRSDVAHMPELWPVFSIALHMALSRDDEDGQAPFFKKLEDISQNDEYIDELIQKACVKPLVGEEADDETIPFWALDEIDRRDLVNKIMFFTSGISTAAAAVEAAAISRFREDGSVSAGNGGSPEGGEASERTDRRNRSVESTRVGSGTRDRAED